MYKVGHHGTSVHECSSSVRPLYVIQLAAIVTGRCSVEDPVVIGDKTDRPCPIVALSSPVGICLVARVPGQPGCKLKEGPLRQSLLVIVPLIEGENLPAQATATVFRIPTTDLVIENIYS